MLCRDKVRALQETRQLFSRLLSMQKLMFGLTPKHPEEMNLKIHPPIHPSLKQGVSLGDRAHPNGKCHVEFDSKAGRIMQVGTNSAQPFWRKGAVLGLLLLFRKTQLFFWSSATSGDTERSLIARQFVLSWFWQYFGAGLW